MEDEHTWSRGASDTEDASAVVQLALVHSYLQHHCYGGTAQALSAAARGGLASAVDPSDETTSTHTGGQTIASVGTRLPVIREVMHGDVAKAIRMAVELEPEIFTKRRDVLLDLLCLQFVDIVRRGDTRGAIAFAKSELAPFGYGDARSVERLEECLALLAYSDPESSPVGQLMKGEFRAAAADALNGAMLQAANLPDRAPLERVVQQLTATRAALEKDGLARGFRFDHWISAAPNH